MGQLIGASGSPHDDLNARMDELERIVQEAFGSRSVAGGPAAAGTAMSHRVPVASYNFASLGRSDTIGRIARTPDGSCDVVPKSFAAGRARLVRERIRQRRQREHFFPTDLFADPAWDMLLDLYAAYYENREISVSSLCIAASVPATTALRWIKSMADDGYLERIADPDDGRRIHVRLSETARRSLDDYYDNLEG